MTRARIIGIGAYAPKRILTNAELEKMVDTSDEWIVQRTGIRERHIVDESEGPSDLAIRAAQQAMERASVVPGGDRLHRGGHHRGGHALPDHRQHRPASARLPRRGLGRHARGVRGLGLQPVHRRRSSSRPASTAPCSASAPSALSRITDFTDRGTCILLADAAGAAVLRPADGRARHHRHRSLLATAATASS